MPAFSAATAESYLAAIVQSSDVAILSRDIEGRITSWNPAAEALLGYAEQDIVGRQVSTIIPDDLLEQEKEILARINAGETVRRFETARLRQDGARVDVMVTMSPVKDADGTVVGASSIVRSLADWRRAEFDPWRLAAIVEWSDDAIASKDLNGIVRSWNPAAERMFGFTAAEMIGQSITKIIPKERLSEEDNVLARVRAGLSVDHFETVRQRKDGSLIDISLTVSPVKNAAGRIVGVSKIARDITEKKRLAELRLRAAEQEERARRMELEAENRRMQEANRLKSVFVANMSHELRTPLNSIIGFAELMVRGKVGEMTAAHREYVADILASARHLAQLIDDVLDLAKIESGRIDFKPEPVVVRDIVAEVTAIVRGLATERHHEISVEVDPGLDQVVLDPGKLKQVLYNYLSNAIKFSEPRGGIVVRVRPDGPDWFRIEVEDRGIGIPAGDIDHLFIEFQQLDSSRAKQYPGTGLGLALTKRIVEAQGGTVGVRSAPGKGSTFFATLPRSMPAGGAASARQSVRETA